MNYIVLALYCHRIALTKLNLVLTPLSKWKVVIRYRPRELVSASSGKTWRIWCLPFGGFLTQLWEKLLALSVAAMVVFLNNWFVHLTGILGCVTMMRLHPHLIGSSKLRNKFRTYSMLSLTSSGWYSVFSLILLHSYYFVLLSCTFLYPY